MSRDKTPPHRPGDNAKSGDLERRSNDPKVEPKRPDPRIQVGPKIVHYNKDGTPFRGPAKGDGEQG